MYRLVYYLKRADGSLYNGTIVAGYAYAPRGVCEGHKKHIKHTTHRFGVLKVEKI